MPVLIDSAASNGAIILGASATASVSATININPNAADRAAIVGVYWNGGVNASAVTFTASLGGDSMTEIGSVLWDSNQSVLKMFALDDPDTGSKTITAGFTGMGTEALTRSLMVVGASYSGVDAIGVADDNSGGSTSSNSIAIDSVAAAHRVVTVHACGDLDSFVSFNKVQRAKTHTGIGLSGQLLIGDAAGAATVTSTATHLFPTAQWGAIGVALTPAIVSIEAGLQVALDMGAATAFFREGTPSPRRYWRIKA